MLSENKTAPVKGVEYTQQLVASEAKAVRELTEWRKRGCELAIAATNRQFEIGDWLIYGEDKWRRVAYAQALPIFDGYTRKSLRNLASVARHVPVSLRNDKLSWNHHVAVARFEKKPEYQKQWLDKAAAIGWSSKELRQLINRKHPPTKKAKTTVSNVRLAFSNEQHANIEKLAQAQGVAVDKLLRDVVLKWMAKPETVAELQRLKSERSASDVV